VDPPTFVKFVGKSGIFNVTGEHEIREAEGDGSTLTNRFVVDGKVPGVETFFERNLDGELDRLQRKLEEDGQTKGP